MNRTPSKQNPQHTFEVYTQIILKDVREAKQYAIEHNLIRYTRVHQILWMNLINYQQTLIENDL